jgi:hypothetical protein
MLLLDRRKIHTDLTATASRPVISQVPTTN